MREILFRGKRIDNGEWVYGVPIFDEYQWFIIEEVFECDEYACVGTESKVVVPKTVGQYTGLKDKNGKRIFEGDIFRFADEVWTSFYTSCGTEYDSVEVENYGVVGFNEDRGCFDFVKYKFNENSVEANLHENHDIEFSDFVSSLEIIGNIHDNPELLEVEHGR